VLVGGPIENGDVPAVWHDERAAVVDVVRYLAALGHRRIARVSGVTNFAHTEMRTDAFRSATEELGLPAEIVSTDFTPETGARVTRSPGTTRSSARSSTRR
jgi:DNA-binding LacI/PurR family transcriptional regulator